MACTKFWQGFSLLCAVWFASGCGAVQQQLISVTVSPQSAVVAAGQAAHFTANVAGDMSGVVWSVNRVVGGSAAVGTIDVTGNYAAPMTT